MILLPSFIGVYLFFVFVSVDTSGARGSLSIWVPFFSLFFVSFCLVGGFAVSPGKDSKYI